MSWGSTAFTPIVTRNIPPFGFHEVINPPDFKVCNQNPWNTGKRMKREIQDAFKLDEYRRKLNITDRKDYDMGYDLDYDHAQQLRCVEGCGKAGIIEQFISGDILGVSLTKQLAMTGLVVFVLYYLCKNGFKLSMN